MPKPRRVLISLELHTDISLNELRDKESWSAAFWGEFNGQEPKACMQVHANVIKHPKGKKR